MTVQISVIICTYGHSRYLHSAIESVINQTLLPEFYEIIIVNGNNQNALDLEIKDLKKFPNLIIITESRPGLSAARNEGCRSAKGKFIVFMDDDAIADINWLSNIQSTFLHYSEEIEAVGGKIEPLWEDRRPDWLSDELLSGLSLLDFGESNLILNPDQFLYGTNMAFRRSVLLKLNGFNENLGRKGKVLLSNEEIYLQKKINESGGLRLFNPEIKVMHHIPTERLTKEWFIKRYYWQGISDAVLKTIEENPPWGRKIFNITIKIVSLLISPKDIQGLLLLKDNDKKFKEQCFAYTKLGKIVGSMTKLKF